MYSSVNLSNKRIKLRNERENKCKLRKWIVSTDIIILIALVLQVHVMMLFCENITESQKLHRFLRVKHVINDN